MLIGLNTSLGVFDVEVELFEFLQNKFINGDPVKSHNNPTVQRNSFTLITPFMTVNLLQTISFRWVYVQNLLQQVFELLRNKVWKHILTWKNFLIKLRSVAVLKRQITANHCKQNHPAWPNVDFKSVVLLASNHLWRRITRRATGCLEHLPGLVSVT